MIPLAGLVVYGTFFRGTEREFGYDEHIIRTVWVIDDGLRLPYAFSGKKTAEEFLREKNLIRERSDRIGYPMEGVLFGGESITIEREKKITVAVGGEEKREFSSVRMTAYSAVADEKIAMGEDDFILPSPDAVLRDGLHLEIVRVKVTEVSEKEDIAFTIKVTEDDDLGWREKKVRVKGEKGVREKKYKVVSHNGKTVKKTLLSNEVVKEPIAEELVQGTYVKLGKKHTGQGTWYAHTGTLAAASPWLPMGSYAKVTNTENGKSVIVKINDRGPTGPGRIIDLDKVAFKEIASIGAGVIGVVVEEVLN